MIASLSVVVILGIRKPFVEVLNSMIDEASGVIELLLIPIDWAFDWKLQKQLIAVKITGKTISVLKQLNFLTMHCSCKAYNKVFMYELLVRAINSGG